MRSEHAKLSARHQAEGVYDALLAHAHAALALDSNTITIILLCIHLVGCIWAYYITIGATYTTLSRSAAVWFFSHGPDASGEVVQQKTFVGGVRVVIACAYCVITRHLGSICFGAAILTIMKILRIILTAIEYYTKEQQANNLLLRVALKCAQCCLYCLDRTVKFITYYGFIFVAIEGCEEAGQAVKSIVFFLEAVAKRSTIFLPLLAIILLFFKDIEIVDAKA